MARDSDPLLGPQFSYQDLQVLLTDLPIDGASRTNAPAPASDERTERFDAYLSRISTDLLATAAHGREIVGEIEFGAVLSKIIERAQVLLNGETAAICLHNPTGIGMQQVRPDPNGSSQVEYVTRDIGTPPPVPLEQGQVVQHRSACAACKLNRQVAWCASADLTAREQHIGTLCVMRGAGRPPFGPEQMRTLEMFSAWAAIAIANAQRVRDARESDRAERDRIAAHLHDHAAQSLGLLGLKLQQLEEQLVADGESNTRAQLTAVRALSQEVLHQVRAAFSDLRPQPLQEDLVTALTRCIDAFQDTAHVQVEFTVTGVCSLPPELQTQALHIVREALVNIRRHAEAKLVRVHLARDNESVRVIVQDDGCGFNLKTIGKDRQHLGTTIMRERAQRSGGSLTIETSPGHGTRITLRYPTLHT